VSGRGGPVGEGKEEGEGNNWGSTKKEGENGGGPWCKTGGKWVREQERGKEGRG